MQKLDTETKRLWSVKTAEKDFPTLKEFLEFLNVGCSSLELMTCNDSDTKVPTKSNFIAGSVGQQEISNIELDAVNTTHNSSTSVNNAKCVSFLPTAKRCIDKLSLSRISGIQTGQTKKIAQAIQKLDEIANKSTEDKPYDLFGRYVASEMRQLPNRAAILLQQEIQNCITRCKLNTLDNESVQHQYDNFPSLQSPQSIASVCSSNEEEDILKEQ
ncbi:hypothetical protein TNCV_2001541 [Trichonephila clavipes]|nr:hypothetical protein TNCV_2001541 [Trichonephila clavipes]